MHPDYVNASDCRVTESLQFYYEFAIILMVIHSLGEHFRLTSIKESNQTYEDQLHQLNTLFDVNETHYRN